MALRIKKKYQMTLSVRFKNTHDKFQNKFTYYNDRVQSIVGLKHHKWQIFNQTTNNNKLHDKITKNTPLIL